MRPYRQFVVAIIFVAAIVGGVFFEGRPFGLGTVVAYLFAVAITLAIVVPFCIALFAFLDWLDE